MHPCAAYLDEVEGLLAREELALESEDGETLDACAERRATALSLAWELRAGYEIAQLRRRLAAIQQKQNQLEVRAQDELERLRASVGTVRKQSGYFSGSRHAESLAQKAVHFEKTS